MAELVETQEELRLTKEELQSTQEALGAAQVQIAELEKLKTPAPAFVKAKKKNPQEEEKKPAQKAGGPVQPCSESVARPR